MTDSEAPDEITIDEVFDVLDTLGRPVVTASEIARALDWPQSTTEDALDHLHETDQLARFDASTDPVVWFPADWKDTTDRERIVVFPDRREIIVDHPEQFTRARLSSFARITDTNRHDGYRYELRSEDIWRAPFDSFDELITTVRRTLGDRYDALEDWIENQWARAHKFRLTTHDDGYVVLTADSPDLLGNVAEPKLPPAALRARISDTEAWVDAEATATVKRTLYDAGYPVQDDRDLDTGDPLSLDLQPTLRPYQRTWLDRFLEKQAGILVGPPGSGKTIASLGIMAAVGGETLILVPSRDLADQWRDELTAQTSLAPEQIGMYHGGEKTIRPVTIATYQTAGMDRHRALFDDRKWGLIIYDEVHHISSPIFRRSANLQTQHRLGLTSTPLREDDKEDDIYTLIGPPIGTDWEALFDAGYVAEPEVEIRMVPWQRDDDRNAYVSAENHERRQLAAMNPAKIDEINTILATNPGEKALIFVEYLDQGDAIAETLSIPFVSGETPHAHRRRLFEEFRSGPRDALVVSRVGDEGLDLPTASLAISASGLGGSRRQGAQRAGRTMRPVGRARMIVLATRGTVEEDFARQRMRHLASKGVRVQETDTRIEE